MSVLKWIFGGLGFVLGGPIGAVIGAVLGSFFDGNDDSDPLLEGERRGWQGRNGNARRQTTEGDVKISILVLIACVMKADGVVRKSEVEAVKRFLKQLYRTPEEATQALHLLKSLLDANIDPYAVSEQIKQNVNYSTRLEILNVLLGIANADGELDFGEERIIDIIAANLGISDSDYASLKAIYTKTQDPNWAYTALEIQPSASDDDVKTAYRRMAMKYHPDKVASAGEEVKKQATEKFRAINEAYEYIKNARGMK